MKHPFSRFLPQSTHAITAIGNFSTLSSVTSVIHTVLKSLFAKEISMDKPDDICICFFFPVEGWASGISILGF